MEDFTQEGILDETWQMMKQILRRSKRLKTNGTPDALSDVPAFLVDCELRHNLCTGLPGESA